MKSRRITNEVPVEKFVKAFANKYRIEIIKILNKNPEISVTDLADKLHLNLKTASFHISKLNQVGIIVKKYQGNVVLHKLTTRGKSILKFLRILE